jgi:hypothetical protein
MDGIQIDTSFLESAFASILKYSTRSFEEEFQRMCKGIVRDVITFTPPASGKVKGAGVAEADGINQRRGERRILKDMRAMFVPVTLKGSRTYTKVFGRTMQRPVTKPTVERWPNVESDYLAVSRRSKNQRTLGAHRQKRYVDKTKFDALAAKLLPHVGWAAAAWNAAAEKVGVRIPIYAKGKNAPGSVRLDMSDERLFFEIVNAVKYIDAIPGIQSKLQYTVDIQAKKMLRQLPFLIKSAAKNARLNVT